MDDDDVAPQGGKRAPAPAKDDAFGRYQVVAGSVRRRWRYDAPSEHGDPEETLGATFASYGTPVSAAWRVKQRHHANSTMNTTWTSSTTTTFTSDGASPPRREGASIRRLKKLIRTSEKSLGASDWSIDTRGKRCVVGKGMWELGPGKVRKKRAPKPVCAKEWRRAAVLALTAAPWLRALEDLRARRALSLLFFPIAKKWALFRLRQKLHRSMPPPTRDEVLTFGFFRYWPPAVLDVLLPQIRREVVKSGRSVYLSGDPLVYVYLLAEGAADIFMRPDPAAAPTRCGVLRPGATVGDPYNRECGAATLSVWATSDCMLYALPTGVLDRLWAQLPSQCKMSIRVQFVASRRNLSRALGFGKAALPALSIFAAILASGALVSDHPEHVHLIRAARACLRDEVFDALSVLFVPGTAVPGDYLPSTGNIIYLATGRARRVERKERPRASPSPRSSRARLSGVPGGNLGFPTRGARTGGAKVTPFSAASDEDILAPDRIFERGDYGTPDGAAPTLVTAGAWVNDSVGWVLKGGHEAYPPPEGWVAATACDFWCVPRHRFMETLREYPAAMQAVDMLGSDRKDSLDAALEQYRRDVACREDPLEAGRAPPCDLAVWRQNAADSLKPPPPENINEHLTTTASFRLLKAVPNPQIRRFHPGAEVVTAAGFKGTLVSIDAATAVAQVRLDLGGRAEAVHAANLELFTREAKTRATISYRAVAATRPRSAGATRTRPASAARQRPESSLGNTGRAHAAGRMDFMNWR